MSNWCHFNVELTTNENGEWRSYWIKAGTPNHEIWALLHCLQVLSPQFRHFHGTWCTAHTAHHAHSQRPTPGHSPSSSLKCLVVSRNGNWPRAQSCLGLNNPVVGSRDYVICLAFIKVNPKKFRRFPIWTNHRARKSDCRIALNMPIFIEKISLLTHESRFVTK